MGKFRKEKDRLIWTMNGETLWVEPWGQNALRIRSAISSLPKETDYALLRQSSETEQMMESFSGSEDLRAEESGACEPVLEVQADWAEIRWGKIRAVLEEKQYGYCRISFYNQKDELLLREIGNGGALCLKSRNFQPILGGDHKLTVSFDANDGEKLYGMGQYQQERLNVQGCTFELAHRNSQCSVPFVMSDRGYGFLWHNPAIGRASFNANRIEWVAESTDQMDYWITAGDTPSALLETYMQVTGLPPMMPEYGLGFWQCKLRYYSQEQVLSVAREYFRRKIPVDVIVVDFFHWPRMGDFRFDEEFFPDPAEMVRKLREMGMTLMVSVWPQVDHRSENFGEMQDRGYLVRTEHGVNVQMQFSGDSVFFDATHPDARRYVWQKCKKNYYDHGIHLFWLDEAEPEYGGYDFANYRYSIGTVLQKGNLYPQTYSRCFYEGLAGEGEKNIVNLVRAAWAGSQRFGALVWSGDIHSNYESFRSQICAGLSMAMSGIPWWTTDIGGFFGGNPSDPAFQELLVRWFQYACFCPVMRLHGDRSTDNPQDRDLYRRDGTPILGTGNDNELWSYGEDNYPILVRFVRIREALRSYTRSLMAAAHTSGTPPMRPLFYDFPDDPVCYDLKDQFLYGPSILVAPITAPGVTQRSVYLPQGSTWTHLPDRKIYSGGTSVTVDAPIEQIPIFLKDRDLEDFAESYDSIC